MLLLLIYKEVKYHLLSSRFVIVLFFVLVVIIASTIIFCDKYQTELERYASFQKSYKTALESGRRGLNILFKQNFQMVKDTKLTSFLASSTESRIPGHATITPLNQNMTVFGGMGLRQVRTNYVLDKVSDMDLVFIVGIIMSFLAIALSYDSISRDREAGTLKQQLSNPIPRSKILLGKYVALLILLLIPLLLGFILCTLIIQILLGQNIILVIPIEISLSCILAIIYLSIFIWLGLWISSYVSKSTTSLALLLLIWVSVVVLFPYIGGMITLKYHPITSRQQFGEQIISTSNELDKFLQGKETEKDWEPTQKRIDELENISEKLSIHRFTELMGQATTAQSFNFYSPYSAFREAVENIASTGLRYHSKFYEAVQQYRGDLVKFIREQDRLDPLSKHRICSDENLVSISNKPVAPEITPKFDSQKIQSKMEGLQATIPALAYLIFLNILVFFLALISFSKKDVR